MKSLYIKDLKSSQLIVGEIFAIFDVQKAEDKNGKPYLNLTVGDKSGKLSAKIWNEALTRINAKLIKPEKLIALTGKVEDYKGNLQVNIQDIKEVDETQVEDFIEQSQYDVEEMYLELLGHIESITNPELSEVVRSIVKDDTISRKLKYWPAGNSIHHGFRSGLIQHVLEMLTIADSLKKFFPEVDYNILKAGIVLHDLGKIEEQSGGLSSNYTKLGTLLGHIVIGANIFNKFAQGKLDDNTITHITHLILSHHGKLEFGSPVVPCTPEAIALYYIDGLSSKLRGSLTATQNIAQDKEFDKPNFYFENARFWNKNFKGETTEE